MRFTQLVSDARKFRAAQYGSAVVVALAALGVRMAIDPIVGIHALFLPSTIAVIIAARIGGRGPGFAATALSALGTEYLFLERRHPSMMASGEAVVRLIIFVVIGGLISMLVANLRASLLMTARAKEALRESEAQFRTLANAIPQLCWIANADGWIFWYNQRWYEYTGTTPKQMDEWGWKWVHDPLVLPAVLERWQSSIVTGEPFEMVFPLRGADGAYRPFLTRIMPVKNNDGDVSRWFGTNTDISEQSNVEKALRASEARYSTLAEALPAIVFTASRDGRTDYINQRWHEYTGFTFEQTVTEGWTSVIHPAEYERSHAAWIAAIQSGAPYEMEVRLKRYDGVYRWFKSRATPLRDEAGHILKWLGISTDVEDEKKSEERLRESQKLEAMGRLAGGVAHDFNNLLTAISGYNALLMQCVKNQPEPFGYAQEVKGAADRAAELTRQLLSLSRRQVTQPKLIDLNEVIQNIHRLLTRVIGEDIELVTNLHPEPAVIRTDPVQLDQVIMNLAVNARDAMPAGGELRLETAVVSITQPEADLMQITAGDYVMLTASDTGVGMDVATKNRSFEPFFTTKEQGKGTGLGLSIVYGVIKQNDGAITIDSEPGRGSTFKMYFPRWPEPIENRIIAPVATSQPTPTGETLLLVEDEASVRQLVGTMLRNYGYRILEAATPAEAIALVSGSRDSIPLLLTDVLMPQMRGPELASRLRELRPDLRVVFMSGYSDSTFLDPDSLKNASYVQKPFTASQLLFNIENELKKDR